MIKSLEHVSPSEYLLATVGAWVKLARAGLTQPELMSFGLEDRLLVDVEENGEPRSVLVWCYYAEDRSARVLLGYTWLKWRRQGLYTSLYEAMKEEAKALGAVKTVGGVMSDNASMLRLAEKQGRKVTAYWIEEIL